MSKRSERWDDTPASALEVGLLMLDPVNGVEVKIRRLEPSAHGVLIEYEPTIAGVGFFAESSRVLRTRKEDADEG